MIGALRDAGTLDSTLVIVTSDHGESLGEHGEDVHGYFVYEATLRVPLIFRGPGVKPGTRIDALARTIDLYPTILEITGRPRTLPRAGAWQPGCARARRFPTNRRSPNRWFR